MKQTFLHDKKATMFWKQGTPLCAARQCFFFPCSSPITSLFRPAAKCFLEFVSCWTRHNCLHKLNLLCSLCSYKVAGPTVNKTKCNESCLEALESQRHKREKQEPWFVFYRKNSEIENEVTSQRALGSNTRKKNEVNTQVDQMQNKKSKIETRIICLWFNHLRKSLFVWQLRQFSSPLTYSVPTMMLNCYCSSLNKTFLQSPCLAYSPTIYYAIASSMRKANRST